MRSPSDPNSINGERRANGTIDPFYGCLLDELIDYAVNFTFPWSMFPPQSINTVYSPVRIIVANGEFDVYDVPDATNPEPFKNASTFFNNNSTGAAPH
jgi:carboxypeptidase D